MKRKEISDQIRDELKGIAPGIPESHEDGFTVPHNYFNSLADKVFVRIEEEEHRIPGWQLWLQSLLKPRFAMAFASVLVLVVAWIVLTKTPEPHQPLADLNDEEAILYVMNNLSEYSQDDLMLIGGELSWDDGTYIEFTEEQLDPVLDEVLEDADVLMIEELF